MAAVGVPASNPAPTSPLGRYADFVTAAMSVLVIAAAVLAHLSILGESDPFLDSVALVAIGVLYGTARGVQAGQSAQASDLANRANLNTELALAAHRRLDDMNAASAPINHSGLRIGTPADPSANVSASS